MERRICISAFVIFCLLTADDASPAQAPKKKAKQPVPKTIGFLRFSGRANAELEKTQGMLNLEKPFTIEVWFRLGDNPGSMALAGDEGWKNLGEDVVIHRECGWVLRAGKLVLKERSFDFTLGTTGDAKTPAWTRIQTPPLSFDDPNAWHHMAVCRSSESIRIFFDGELAVEQSCKGKTFVASPTNVYLGVRRGTFSDRVFFGDIAGFRMSTEVRYEKPFRPPSVFSTDAQTLFVLDCDKHDPRALLGSPEPKGSPRKGVLAVDWVEEPGQLARPKAGVKPIIEKEVKTGYKDVDAATIDGYEKLGAQYGAWVTRRFTTGFERVEFEPGSKHAESGLPVFLIKSLPTTLPQVAVPFGLDLSQCKVTDADLMRLAGLTNLTALKLHGFTASGVRQPISTITDAGLSQLAALKNLISLDLENMEITGPGLKELEGLDKLASLNLAHSKVTDLGLKGLGGLKNLTSLNLRGTKVKGEGLKYLAGCKHLASLSLDGPVVTDAVFLQLRDLDLLHALDFAKGKDGARPKSAADIVSLDISRTQITAEGLKALAGMKSLRLLVLHYKNPTNQVFDKTRPVGSAELKVLRELGLLHVLPMAKGKDGSRPQSAEEITSFDLAVGDAGLKELAGLTNLRSLKLDGSVGLGFLGPKPPMNPVTDEKVQAFLTKLKERSVTDAGLKELAPFKNLATLTIHSDFVTDAGLKHLAPLKSLTTLDLRSCSISDGGLKELTALPNLATLELGGRQRNMGGGTKFSGRGITDAGLKQLSELKKLTSLFLTDTSVTNTGVSQMRMVLPTCQIFIQTK